MKNVEFSKHFVAALQEQVGRMDAADVAYIARELTFQGERIVADYAPLKSETLAPLETGTPPWAEYVSHPLLSDVGQAQVVADDATDLPIIQIELDDNLSPVLTIGAAWKFAWIELRTPANVNRLDERRRAAVDAVRRTMDQVGMVGYGPANLGGFLNNPSVPVFALPTGDWLNPATTTAQILADLAAWEAYVIQVSGEGGSSGTLYPNTLALPGQEVGVLHRNAGTGTDSSIWEVFAKTSQGKLEGKVEEWELIRTSYAENVGGARRGVMYCKDPSVLKVENPLAYEELRPQDRNLATITPVVGRTAGTIYKRPHCAAYANVG